VVNGKQPFKCQLTHPQGGFWNYFTHNRRARGPVAGAKIALAASRTTASGSALRSLSGTSAILIERLLGLTKSESNHGEDVKEYYFYLDSYAFLHEAPLQVPHATSSRAATRSMTFLPVDVAAAMIVS